MKAGRLVLQSHEPQPTKPLTKRVCLGGRGREWAAESLKLLETLVELDDSKMFIEPMDPLKHQEYYSMISEPIDLSKIMLNFHGGSYASLTQFTHDMKLMFDNYKQYFSEIGEPGYSQVRRLSAWYDSEMTRIMTKWYRTLDNLTMPTPSAGSTTKYTPRIGSFEARIKAIEKDNLRIINTTSLSTDRIPGRTTLSFPSPSQAVGALSMGRSPVFTFRLPVPMQQQLDMQNRPIGPTGPVRITLPGQTAKPVILVPKSGDSTTTMLSSVSSSAGLPNNVVYMQWQPPSNSVPPSVATSLNTVYTIRNLSSCSAVRGITAMSSSSIVTGPSTVQQAIAPTAQSPLISFPTAVTSTTVETKLALKIDVTNIWFGTARNKPTQPVIITEDGFNLNLRFGDTDVPFMILASEIVRCSAYFGNLHKHTLFLFVVPNCTRRLHILGDKFAASTLIVMFLPALTQTQIASLVYLFWRMSHSSVFGELFGEVDQKGALSLLSNIKPTIMSNVADRLNDVLINSTADTQQQQSLTEPDVAGGLYVQDAIGTISNVTSLVPTDTKLTSNGFVEKECKLEPPDDFENNVIETATIENSSVASDETVAKVPIERLRKIVAKGGTKRPAPPHKQTLKIKMRRLPGILTRKHTGASDGAATEAKNNDNNEEGGDEETTEHLSTEEENQPKEEKEEEEEDEEAEGNEEGEFTVIRWYPETELEDGSAVSNEDEGNEDGPPQIGSDKSPSNVGENDLEIVMPSETDPDSNGLSNTPVIDEDASSKEDLVMTGETINIRCPITQQIMRYPMKNRFCGHCYDRQGVENLIKYRGDKAKCPVTGCLNTRPLQMKDVQHEYMLWQHIQTQI